MKEAPPDHIQDEFVFAITKKLTISFISCMSPHWTTLIDGRRDNNLLISLTIGPSILYIKIIKFFKAKQL